MEKEIVQVLLVGGRQTPNVIGAMLLRPSYVELVVSRDAQDSVDALLNSLDGIGNLQIPRNWEIVDAHNYQINLEICRKLCEKHTDKLLQFNLTAGTKVMAFAAYDIARQYQGQAFYVNTAMGEIIWLVDNQQTMKSFRLTIEEYLQTYNRQPVSTFDFEKLTFKKSQAIKIACLLACVKSNAIAVLNQIRQTQGSGARSIPIVAEYKQLVNRLIEFGSVDCAKDTFIVRSNHDWNFFKGDWLEIYAWNEAERLNIFEECKFSLEIPSGAARKELDLVCIYQGQLIHCSCKTDRDPFKTAYLDEIRSVSSLIGGRFCSRVFITNAFFSNLEKKDKFMEQAGQREIVVVTGEELGDLGDILKEQALKPTFQRV